MKTLIVSATKGEQYKDTLLSQSIEAIASKGISIEIEFITNNSTGLSKVYNQSIERYAKEYDCIVFAHDDLYLDDAFIIDKLRDGFDFGYDIIGLAGGINPTIKAPTLWHIMCSRENLRGAVAHFTEDGSNLFVSSFGTCKSRVTVLDGLFLAVNTKRILETGWKFNENYDFHLYDLASCLDANKLKLKMGVLPIHVVHTSHGLLDINDPVFVKNQTQFLKEYAS